MRPLLPNEVIDAYYEPKPSISVFCRLRVVESMTNSRLVVTAGFRKLDDTNLPQGSRLVIKGTLLEPDADFRVIFSTRVTRTHKTGGRFLHALWPLRRELLQYNRSTERKNIALPVYRTSEQTFHSTNLSEGGVRFLYQSKSALTSAALNSHMPVVLEFNGSHMAFHCAIKHVTYNWWDQTHAIGAAFVNLGTQQRKFIQSVLGEQAESPGSELESDQTDLLESLKIKIPPELLEKEPPEQPAPEPTPEPEAEMKSRSQLIDPETGRIRIGS